MSKVRASFVAVERPADISSGQQWGLRKASDVSSMAEVKESEAVPRTSTIETPKEPEQTKSPTSPHTSKQSIDGGLGSILKGSAFDGTPQKRPHEKKTPIKASSPATKKTQAKVSPGLGSRAADVTKKMQSSKARPATPPKTTTPTKSDAKPIKTAASKPAINPTPASPRSPRLERSSPKTPTSPATPKSTVRGGPAKIKGVIESAQRAKDGREAVKKEQPKPVPKKVHEAKTIPERKTQSNPVAKKELESQLKPKVNGVKKEAVNPAMAKPTSPRAPTRPGKLPSAVTATTAAAAAKYESQPSTQQPARKAAPRASLPVISTRATTGTTSSAAHKKSSRASLAAIGIERPKSRASLNRPDEGFVARMMRPTRSSSQKTHEKAQVDSPPRPKATKATYARKAAAGSKTSIKTSRKSDQSESQGSKLDDVTEAPAEEASTLEPSQEAAAAEQDPTSRPRPSDPTQSGPVIPTTVNGTSTATAAN